MVSSSERGIEENGAKKTTLSKSSAFLQQRTVAIKPLCKHTFYLDVKNRTVVSKIEGKIRALGGNIDLFLDKEVTHIVTDKEIPTVNREDIRSPITPTQLVESKSVDFQKGGNGGDRTPSHVTGRLKTRVSAMLEKARGTPTHIEKDIFAEAERLGITVWTIEKAQTWLDKVTISLKPPTRHSSAVSTRYNFRDSRYYIKFESFDRRSRPVFRELTSWPRVNVCGAAAGDGALVTTTPPPAADVAAAPPHRNMTRTTVPPPTTAAVINVIDSIIPGVTRGKNRLPERSNKIATTPPPHPAILNLNQRLHHPHNHNITSSKLRHPKISARKVPLKEKQQANSPIKEEDTVIPGYCELCRVNFSHQYEHFASEKHLKFVGDPKNYTEVDDLIGKSDLEDFLTLNNHQVVPSTTKSNSTVSTMSSTRGVTQARFGSVGGGTSTRPRRHTTFTNSYLEISVDDDLMRPPECCARETRSARTSQTKAASPESDTFWTSGRPKRACIKRNRSSTDDKPPISNQAYYRVEVVSSKALRPTTEPTITTTTAVNSTNSNPKHQSTVEDIETTSTNESKREENGGDKGLIVKFRRMRNSELKQLNNEAVNFLFPRKDDSSSEEDLDDNCPETTISSAGDKAAEISVVISSEDDETVDGINETDTTEQIRTNKTKEEVEDTDENHSVDSNWSDCNTKKNQNHKRRRTHAEAFINDNQKYYKFETPGSRLRYQGTFMSTHDLNTEQALRPRFNGENPLDTEDSVAESSEEDLECKQQQQTARKLRLEHVKYSYEMKPASEPWYQTFVRQDQGLEHYTYHKSFSEGDYYKPFYLPHQLPPLQPLDPRVCFAAYDRLKRLILEEADISPNPTPSSSTGNSTPTSNEPSTAPSKQEDTARTHEETEHQLMLLNGIESSAAAGDVKTELAVGHDADEVDSLELSDMKGHSNSSNSQQGSLEGGACDDKPDVEAADSKDTTRIDLEQRRQQRQRQKRLMKAGTSGRSPGRNSRKSPRQHASTLAILSLLQQRKRREIRSKCQNITTLDPIQERNSEDASTSAQQSHGVAITEPMTTTASCIEPQSAEAQELAKLVSTIDRMNAAIAAETDDIDDFHVDINVSETPLLQTCSKTDAIAILEDYEKHRDVLSKTGLSHGANKRSYSPGKKPGRKRKKKRKNMTGWPNVVKKLNTGYSRKEMDDSTIDSLSVTAESEDDANDVSLPVDSLDMCSKFEIDEGYDVKLFNRNLCSLPTSKPSANRNSRSSVKSDKKTSCSVYNNVSDTKNRVDVVKEETLSEDDTSLSNCKETKIIDLSQSHCCDERQVIKSETTIFQPVVRVEKLNNRQLRSSGVVGRGKSVSRSPPVSPPRPQRAAARRMPASPRSPRVLRKPRGRWYRER